MQGEKGGNMNKVFTDNNEIETPNIHLKRLLTPQDQLSVDKTGNLLIEEVSARELINQYGSPLYVLSETTIRKNYNRIKKAFEKNWPKPINILYAIKSNPNIAIRSILYSEGAGGDCFSLGEIQATFEGGADPEKIVVNGSYKPDEVIQKAIKLGLTINLDSEEEVDSVERIAIKMGSSVKVAIRMKVLPEDYFKDFESDLFKRPDFLNSMRRSKWGEIEDGVLRIIKRLKDHSHLKLFGYHTHLGRASREPQMFGAISFECAKSISNIFQKTGFAPSMIDLGGGWARERDPESGGDTQNPYSIENYAEEVCKTMLPIFEKKKVPLPEIWIESGRYLIGNAGVFLTSVGLIKEDKDLNFTWVNVDSSTNDMLQVDLFDYKYSALVAEGMNRPNSQKVDLVGMTCVPSVFLRDFNIPNIQVGEIIAILDSGMYSEAKGNNFNSLPRPASALVRGNVSYLIRKRETINDLFSSMKVPVHLRKNIK